MPTNPGWSVQVASSHGNVETSLSQGALATGRAGVAVMVHVSALASAAARSQANRRCCRQSYGSHLCLCLEERHHVTSIRDRHGWTQLISLVCVSMARGALPGKQVLLPRYGRLAWRWPCRSARV
jgi:hypothetical protein